MRPTQRVKAVPHWHKRSSSTFPVTDSVTPRASIEVINAILTQRPETRVGVRTSAPRWLFDLTVKGKVAFSTLECDTGVVQVDALTLDEADSIRRAQSFHSDMVTRAASETRALRELGAGLIVGDIPPLAFAVGASAGIPSIGLANFTWDWVYADYPRVRLAPSLLPTIRGAYAKASMALRLPMSGGFESFSNVRDLPFVARHASRTREEVCKTLKIPADKPIVLASFGGYGLTALDTDVLSKFKKYTVVTTVTASLTKGRRDAPTTEKKGSVVTINEEAMYGVGVRYEDLVGASEAVVTKPGYGIVSECIANDAAILYTGTRPLPGIRRHRRGDAEVPALGLHQPRRSVCREMGVASRQAAESGEAEEEA